METKQKRSPRGPYSFREKSQTYTTWADMHSRVISNSSTHRPIYKDKGIGVSEEWRSYEKFYKDMGDQPEGLILGRIDKNKSYSKENCKWMTFSESGKCTTASQRLVAAKAVEQALLPFPTTPKDEMACYTDRFRTALKKEEAEALKKLESARKKLQLIDALNG